MLIRFTVENFMSFRDKTEFNMLTGDVRRHKNHVTNVGGVEVLRAAAIYGANGSGKSNLLKALNDFICLLDANGGLKESEYCKGEHWFKLDSHSHNKATSFSMEVFINDNFYEFGVEFKELTITREWLNKINPGRSDLNKWVYVRTTTEDNLTELKVNPELYNNANEELRIEILQNNFKDTSKLILNNLSFFGFFDIDNLIHLMPLVVIEQNLTETMKGEVLVNLLRNFPAASKRANEAIALADIGIKKVVLAEYPIDKFLGINESNLIPMIEKEIGEKGYYNLSKDGNWTIAVKKDDEIIAKSLKFFHKNDGDKLVEFSPVSESDGTLTALALLFSLTLVSEIKSIVVIDEIEKSIHPLLIKKLLEKFMAQDEVKGQLIFTTHESQLLDLDIFRQDEIWFTEKNKEGATQMYPLTEFNPRYDLDVRKGYLTGRFGAIPFLGRLDDLNWNKRKPETV